MNVGVYNLKHNRTMYAVMFGAFTSGLKKHNVNFEVYNIKFKGFKPIASHDLAVTFTNAPRAVPILDRQKKDKNKYLTLYIGAFSKSGVVNFRNRNKIFGWDTNTRPTDDALLYCDMLGNDYMRHDYYIGRTRHRLNQLNNFGVELKPYKQDGCILIPEQIHPEGMGHGVDNWLEWAIETCAEIRKYTDKKIRIRRHPNRTAWKDYTRKIEDLFKDVEFTYGEQRPFKVDLEDTYAVVTLSSRCIIEALVNGCHIFTRDVNSPALYCSNFVHTISKPKTLDRRQWLADIAYSHWSIEEIQNGDYWDYCKTLI